MGGSLDIKDIAHALSLICRGNGHVQHFYSVAQHSLACAKEAKVRGYRKEIILGCLLHDASEAYLSDVTRPIKKELTYYLEVEDVLQNSIWKYFIQCVVKPPALAVGSVNDFYKKTVR